VNRTTINGKRQKYHTIAGDFNCPDIDWTNMITKIHANDKEIQKSLIDLGESCLSCNFNQ
jgi:hypothetical protein